MLGKIFAVAVCALPLQVFSNPALANQTSIVVGLPEDYGGPPDELKAQVNRLLASQQAGSATIFVALPSEKTIASVVLPDQPRFNNPHIRLRYQAPALQLVNVFIDNAAKAKPTISALPSQVLPSQSIDDITANFLLPGDARTIIIIGSGQQDDRREPSFSMRGGKWPSDALIAGRDSPYSTASRVDQLTHVSVHFCLTEKPSDWVSPMAEAHAERIWSLFVSGQGGQLATFSPDLASCFNRAMTNAAPAHHYELDKQDTRLEMRAQEPDRVSETKAPSALPQQVRPPVQVKPALLPRKAKTGSVSVPVNPAPLAQVTPLQTLKHWAGKRAVTNPCGVEALPAYHKPVSPPKRAIWAWLKPRSRPIDRMNVWGPDSGGLYFLPPFDGPTPAPYQVQEARLSFENRAGSSRKRPYKRRAARTRPPPVLVSCDVRKQFSNSHSPIS